jgi:multidrug efflux pump subunit AcrB
VADVASVEATAAEATAYVTHRGKDGRAYPAVTVAIAKRAGTNAITLTSRIEQKLDELRGVVLPADVHLTIVRNYGDSAADKSNELLWHMLLAVLSVSVLIAFALGRREALVVLTAIPVTLALTLFVFYLYGYSLNRITLFALIFSIGILVDDAIVVVENMARHAHHHHGGADVLDRVAVAAVNEVGNPTILATLTVVAAILPMAFVGGLMGPYMRPIPVGASAAMIFSLLVAFIVTPWAAVRLMKVTGGQHGEAEDWLTARYRVLMRRTLSSTRSQLLFLGSIALLLAAAMALVPLGLVTVKMLPFDNKSEFQVIVNMPEGTALEDTARATSMLADAALGDPEVVSVQAYSGAASPYNFNGLVRHYFLRQAAHQGDLQVNLLPKDERRAQSHPIAVAMRQRLTPIAARLGARIQVSEVPPGPPVLQTLVAEIYGPDESRRVALASQVKDLFQRTNGVVDVDWYVERDQPLLALQVDTERAAAVGIDSAHVAGVAALATSGGRVGLLHDATSREDVPIVLRLPPDARRSTDALGGLYLHGQGGTASLAALVRPALTTEARAIYHKNLAPVTYVIGDVAGGAESPVYAILQMNRALEQFRLLEGYRFEVFSTRQPDDSTRYAMKWDGEWHITYEVFRDLGIAFAAVLVLIYVLVVGWFQSFLTPLVIMAAIPFSLVGILPAHAALGAFFTATSMIGFIAGAGIVVRNSIILVDFIELRLRSGMPFQEAVIDAGAVRFRPMALTAAAVVVGSAVILFDPIFQGLAVSLMAGEVASLLLSRAAVPVMYHLVGSRRAHAPEGGKS